MAPALAELLRAQYTGMPIEIWMEPFAGGAGAGLSLLERGEVEEFWITEKHPAVAAFWRIVAKPSVAFADLVEATTPGLTQFELAKEQVSQALSGQEVDDMQLALSAFIVNRCSRSGIITPAVGPIGGKKQDGRYRITDRWNSKALADRIRRISDIASGGRLKVDEGDAADAIRDLSGSGIEDEVFLFVDPPYLREGNRLYEQGMSEEDHQALADALNACPSPWLLTYDDEPKVAHELYPERRSFAYRIANTANVRRDATEYAVISDTVTLPNAEPVVLLPHSASEWVRT